MLLKRLITAMFFLGAPFLGVPGMVWARSAGAPPGTAGVPGEGLCSACHLGTANSGSGRVQLQVPGNSTTYQPGQSVRLTVQLQDEGARRWGFQLTARSASSPTTAAGILALVAGDSNAQIVTANNLQYATHTSAGTRQGTAGPTTWELDWTPPATGGPVTFYLAGNAANNSLNNQGDQIYTSTLTLQPANAEGPSATMRALPQWVSGGGWYSAMYFFNGGSSAATVPVFTFGADGQIRSTENLNLPAGGSTVVEAANTGPLTQGWAGADMPSNVFGYGVFRQSLSGRQDQEAVVPFAVNPASQRSTILFDDTGGLRTAVAVANPSTTDTTVTVTALNTAGQAIGTSFTIALRARERQAFVLRDRPELSGVAGQRGSVEFRVSTGAVSVLGLRFGGEAFTSIPSIER